VKVELHALLTSSLDVGERSASWPTLPAPICYEDVRASEPVWMMQRRQ